MEENLYAPPKAVVADVQPISAEPRFFAVSAVKLVVMFFFTAGLYQLYWFYKHWSLIKKHTEPDIWPWARTLFSVFWCYSCFETIRRDEKDLCIVPELLVGPLAILWILLQLTYRLPEPYSLLPILSPLVLVPVQRHINRINAMVAPDHEKNSRISPWNWLAIVVGGVFWVFVAIGLTVPS